MANVRWFADDMGDMVPVAALLEMGAEIITGGERKVLQRYGARHGRTYKRRGAKAYYTASAPGEPPAIAERSLLRGIGRSNSYQISEGVWGIQMGSNAMSNGVHYPAILESPDYEHGQRPSWMIAFKNSTKKIMALFANKALRRKVGA